MVAASLLNAQLFVVLASLTSTAVVRAAPCTLCMDGSEPAMPNKLVQVPGYPQIDCKSLDSLVPQLLADESSEQCGLVHQLSTLCGCPRLASTCNLCPDGSPVSNPNANVESYSSLFGGITPNCEVVEAYLHSFAEDEDLCSFSQGSVAEACGCLVPEIDEQFNATGAVDATDVDGEIPIDLLDLDSLGISTASGVISGSTLFGVETDEQMERHYRVSLSALILSLIGYTIVLLDCLWSKQRRKNLYNQIIATMAVFDIVLSTASAFGTLPMSTDDFFVASGEAGNEATCKIQGFFIQWGGVTSIFFNASLSTFYGTRESRFRQLRKWMIGIPIFLGTGLAAASVPFIKNGIIGCHLLPPLTGWVSREVLETLGVSHSWAAFLCCMVVPAFSSIAYSTGALIRVYFHMRQVDKNSDRWRFKSSQQVNAVGMKRTRQTALYRLRTEVFWQSATYLVALYVTWLIYLSVTLNPKRYILSHYELWTFLFFISPLQGFLNSICYFRPRVSRYWKTYWIAVRKRRQAACHKFSSNVSDIDSTHSLNDASSSLHGWDQIGAVEPAADLINANEAAVSDVASDGIFVDNEDPSAVTGGTLVKKLSAVGGTIAEKLSGVYMVDVEAAVLSSEAGVEGRSEVQSSDNECHPPQSRSSSLTVDSNTPPHLGHRKWSSCVK